MKLQTLSYDDCLPAFFKELSEKQIEIPFPSLTKAPLIDFADLDFLGHFSLNLLICNREFQMLHPDMPIAAFESIIEKHWKTIRTGLLIKDWSKRIEALDAFVKAPLAQNGDVKTSLAQLHRDNLRKLYNFLQEMIKALNRPTGCCSELLSSEKQSLLCQKFGIGENPSQPEGLRPNEQMEIYSCQMPAYLRSFNKPDLQFVIWWNVIYHDYRVVSYLISCIEAGVEVNS